MTDFDNVNILLVEDNEQDAEMTLRALKEGNFFNKVYRVSDGVEALAFIRCLGTYEGRCRDELPKLVLLDLKMPRLGGLDVLRELKADERTRAIPIIAMTSSNHERDLAETSRLGISGYLTKPIVFASFVETVAQCGMYWRCLDKAPVASA